MLVTRTTTTTGGLRHMCHYLKELGVVADEPMVGSLVDEIAKPIVEADEQVITPVIDMEEDIPCYSVMAILVMTTLRVLRMRRMSESIMGEPLSPDRVFDFSMDEPKPHPAYDFFAPGPLPGYAVDEIAEPIVEAEEQEVNKEWLMALVTPPLMPVVPSPSTYEVGGLSIAATKGQSFPLLAHGLHVPPSRIKDLITRMGNLEYEHGQIVKKVIQVSDAEVADGITIREISLRVSTIEGHVLVMASQMVQKVDKLEHVGAQVEQGQQTATQRDEETFELSQHV
nr:hypothetical protein [Tanacetum cinerariifolium]